MQLTTRIATAVLAMAGLTGAHAALVPITTNGSWNTFDVAEVIATDGGLGWIDITTGGALTFSFTVDPGTVGTLTVVDAGFSGDQFSVFSNGVALRETSRAVNSYPTSIGLDFDAALANASYSRGVYSLAAGSYVVGGSLLNSAFDETGARLNSTVGGLKVEVTSVSAVPLPAAALLLLPGLGVMGFTARRRAVNVVKKD